MRDADASARRAGATSRVRSSRRGDNVLRAVGAGRGAGRHRDGDDGADVPAADVRAAEGTSRRICCCPASTRWSRRRSLGLQDQSCVRRGLHDRAQRRDGARTALARLPDRSAGTYFQHFWGTDSGIGAGRHRRPAQNQGARAGRDAARTRRPTSSCCCCAAACCAAIPNAIIYLTPAVTGTSPTPPPDIYPDLQRVDGAGRQLRRLSDRASGGDRARAAGPGYFVVIQEHPTEPRFGLDAAVDERIGRQEPSCRSARSRRRACRSRGAPGAANSAHMAEITRRLPVRITIHASQLVSRTDPVRLPERRHATSEIRLDDARLLQERLSRYPQPAPPYRRCRSVQAICRSCCCPVRLETRFFTLADGAHRAARARLPGQDSPRQPRARPDGGRADVGTSTTGSRTGVRATIRRRASRRGGRSPIASARAVPRGSSACSRRPMPSERPTSRDAGRLDPLTPAPSFPSIVASRRATRPGDMRRRRGCCRIAGSPWCTRRARRADDDRPRHPAAARRRARSAGAGARCRDRGGDRTRRPAGDRRRHDVDDRLRRGGIGRHGAAHPDRRRPCMAAGIDSLVVFGVVGRSRCRGRRPISWPDLLDAHHYTDGLAFVRPGTPTNNTDDRRAGYGDDDPGHERSFATRGRGHAATRRQQRAAGRHGARSATSIASRRRSAASSAASATDDRTCAA